MGVYWTMRNGNKISVDDMDITHLRNTLKMIIKNSEKAKATAPVRNVFEVRGEIAREMIENEMLNELMGDELDEWYGC